MVHGIEAVACIFEPADNVRQRGGRVLRGVGVTRIESTTENYKKIGSPDTAPLLTGISRIIERQNS